ncbi:MAG: type II toxin-antitoxin system VapC family toxin [Promethearchaeota archaeon]
MIILDTDVLINLLDRKPSSKKSAILDKLNEHSDEEIVTTVINLEEFLCGVIKKDGFIDKSHPVFQVESVPFLTNDAIRAAELEIQLEKSGKQKPRIDVIIASIALGYSSKIFTFNVNHFQDIDGLELIEV